MCGTLCSDLLFHCIQIEAGTGLHRREFDSRLGQLVRLITRLPANSIRDRGFWPRSKVRIYGCNLHLLTIID